MKPQRLVLRLYLVTLAQFLAVAVTFGIIYETVVKPPPPPYHLGRPEDFAVRKAASDRGDPTIFRSDLERTRRDFGLQLTLYTREGKLVGSTHDPPPPPLPEERLAELVKHHALPGDRPNTVVVPVRENGLLVAYGIVDLVGPPASVQIFPYVAIVIVLGFVLVGSALFARALAQPLGRIAGVARAFGRGKLDARLRLGRQDELGEVADAFDDMADRVTRLLRGQRELLANVSHELRTPLARIRVALDLAAEGDAESARQAVADIAEDWGDLDRLVEDVLAAARLELGGTVPSAPALRVEPLELGPVLERAAARFRLAHPGRQLTVEAEDPLPAVAGDAAMLTRVLANLLDNARKYSDGESEVALRARADDGNVVIEIADHGIGIDPADLPHVGTPFFRGDRSRARTTGGVGLGLALARRIVEGHGGRLDVESEPAAGTTVRFTLPNILRTSDGEQIRPFEGSN